MLQYSRGRGEYAECLLAFSRRGVTIEEVLAATGKDGLHVKMLPGWTRDIFGEECSEDSQLWMSCILRVVLV